MRLTQESAERATSYNMEVTLTEKESPFMADVEFIICKHSDAQIIAGDEDSTVFATEDVEWMKEAYKKAKAHVALHLRLKLSPVRVA